MKQIKQILASSVLLLATALPAYSTVDESAKIQQVNFTVQVSRQVERDNMQVTLYAQESGKTLKEISASVTNKINMAVDEAKKRNIQTGMTTRRTNITYDKQGKPNGWIDYAEITLESKDFTALSELIAATSEQLAVQNISFTVSDETKQSLEKELTEQALLAFKQKAELISKNLSAKGYQIANLDIGNPNDFGGDKQPIYYERKAMFSSSDVPNMQVQSGMVDLKMVVNATINLTNN
jgi:predicted secreted protein